jgi:hypothetical protein
MKRFNFRKYAHISKTNSISAWARAAYLMAFFKRNGERSTPITLNPLIANGMECRPGPHAKSSTLPDFIPVILEIAMTSSLAFIKPDSGNMKGKSFSQILSLNSIFIYSLPQIYFNK